MTELQTYRLGEVIDVTDYVANGSFESLRDNVSAGSEPDYAIMVRLVDHNASWSGPYRYVTESSYKFLSKSSLETGDVIVANVGANAGTVFRVPQLPLPSTLGPNAVLCRPRKPEFLNREFFYYLLSGPIGRSLLDGIISGSAQPKFNKTSLRQVAIKVPPIAKQKAIAEVLGALDDKIAANTKLANTADQFLAALFAHITAGTSTLRLGDVAIVNPESCKPVRGGILRYVDISSVGQGTFEFPEISSWDEAPSRARRSLKSGDTLWSTVRPNRRSHALNLSNDPLLVGSTGLAILRPREVGFAYLFEATKTPAFTAYLENVAEGSAYPAVRANRFDEAPIFWAPPAERDSFETMAAPLRRALHILDSENVHLVSVRDALLPQLMSGKLKIKEAKEIVASAV